MLIALLLAAIVLVSVSVLAIRLAPESRAEAWLATMILWIAVVHGSVHVLGWLEVLHRSVLATTIVGISVAVALSAAAKAPRAELGTRLLRHLCFPFDALRETYAARSFAFVALVYVVGVLCWSALLVVLAPTGTWDGLWYHEPMAGFALGAHGFSNVEVPGHLETVNGYPRLSENLMLFASAFGDRALIDGVPHVMVVTSLLATYCFARRFTRQSDHAIGAACVLVTIPGVVLQLRSTYVDVAVLATFVAAVHYASVPRFTARGLYLLALSLGLLGGTKSTALLYVAVIGLWGLIATARAMRHASRGFAAHAVLATLLCFGLFAPTFVRNYVSHDNPIWPLRYEIHSLGVEFEGPLDIQNMQLPFEAVMAEMFGFPIPDQDFPDTRHHGYGYGLTYLGVPLILVGLFAVLRRWVRRTTAPTGVPYGGLLFAFFLGLVTLLTSPAFYWARYALPLPAFGLVLMVALVATRPRGIEGGPSFFAMLLVNAITLAWASPRWDVTFAQAQELWDMPREERVYAEGSPLLFSPETRRWRDEHIGPGEVVAIDDEEVFIANAWNDGFTNIVRYVPYHSPDAYIEALDEAGAIWVMCRRGSGEDRALLRSSSWAFQATVINDTQLYMRASP